MDVENQTETSGPKTFRSKMVTIVSLGLVCVGGALMVASTHGTTAAENQISTPVQASLARTLSGQPKYDAVPSKSPSAGLHKPTWKPTGKPVEHASKQGAALPKVMNLLETPVAVKAAPAGGAAGASVSGAVKQAGGGPPEGTLAAHPKTATTDATTTTEASPAIMSATLFDTTATATATRRMQVAAPVKPASGTGGPSGQAPPAAGATGPVLPVDIVVDTSATGPDGCPTCASDADCAAVGYGPCVNGKCQPKASAAAPATTVSGPVTPIDTPDGPVFPGDVSSTDAAPSKPAAQSGGGAKTAPKPAALYTKTTMKSGYAAANPTKSPSAGLHKPTWKPSAKPAEHASKQGAALPRRALKQDFLQTTAILKSPEESLSADNLEATKIHAANAQALQAQGGKDEGISTKKVLADQQQETVYAAIAAEKKGVGSALYSTGGKVTVGKKDADPCHDGLSPRCTPPTSKPVEHRSLAGSPTKSPSSGLHKPTWKPSSKPNEHRRLAGTPTKSPSSGLHKPTWRPSSKPAEHSSKSEVGAALPRQLSNAHPGDLTTSTAGKGAFAEVGPSKSPSTGIHKPTWKPTQGKPSGKPVEPWKEGVESSHKEDKNSAHTDGEIEKEHTRVLSAVPVTKDDADPCHDGLSPRCTPPTSKPVEHASKQGAALPRRLSGYKAVGSPTKSPSTGIMKPTWKPSSKPAERKLKGSSKTSSKAEASSSSSLDSKKSSSKASTSSSSDKSDKSSTKKSSGKSSKSDETDGPPPPPTDDTTPPPPPPTDDTPPPPPPTDDTTPPPPPPTDDTTPPPPPPAPDAPATTVTTTKGQTKPLAAIAEGETPVEGKMLLPPAKNSHLSKSGVEEQAATSASA